MMDKASEAAALAGVAQSTAFSATDRLAAAKKALDYYVDQADKLQGLIDWCNDNLDDEEHGAVYADVAVKLEAIRDGE